MQSYFLFLLKIQEEETYQSHGVHLEMIEARSLLEILKV